MSIPRAPYRYQLLIDGRWVEATSGERYTRDSPAHGVSVGDYALAGDADVDAAVAAARRAFDDGPWPRLRGAERARVLHAVGDAIDVAAEELARIEVLESGKPISQARAELESTVDLWHYAATLARAVHGDSYNTLGEDMVGLMVREPIGVVAMITPWNFPLLIISQKLPFALAAGCTAVVKPSELTPGTTLRLGGILQAAGLPDGVVNIITGYGVPAGAQLAAHHGVDMISFTGSTAVGREVVVASQGNLKKVALELGGKNPQIVFADADLAAAVDAVVFGVAFNQGECCNSGSRVLVQRSIADEFVAAVIEHVRTLPVGDPLDPRTKVGAIINEQQMDKVLSYIAAGHREGAVLRHGGGRLANGPGRFVQPTVFDRVQPTMAIARGDLRSGACGDDVRHTGRGHPDRQQYHVWSFSRCLDR
jgi:betaine-aldehyde dehydrogenase